MTVGLITLGIGPSGNIPHFITFGLDIGAAPDHTAALGRTAFVARSARTLKPFRETRTAIVARDPGDATIPEQ